MMNLINSNYEWEGKKKGRKECFCLIFSSFLFLHVDKDDAMNDAKSPKMMVKKNFSGHVLLWARVKEMKLKTWNRQIMKRNEEKKYQKYGREKLVEWFFDDFIKNNHRFMLHSGKVFACTYFNYYSPKFFSFSLLL